MHAVRATVLVLGLLLAGSPLHAAAGDDPWDDDWNDDPFAAFDDEEWDDPWATRDGGLSWSGFVEGGAGGRWASVENLDTLTLAETRWRAETTYRRGALRADFKGDLLYDHVPEQFDLEVRELAAAFGLGPRADVKVGRQVLTWGTGDLLFLNDLFPKDFISFFAGRDEDYLKAPADTARISVFTAPVNIDLAITPRFQADEYLYGERFAFWIPALGQVAAPADPARVDEPSTGEIALRLFRTVGATEYALYAYRGRYKQPLAVGPEGLPRFPRLQSWGASARTPLHRGLFNVEAAWYDSRDDRDGTDPGTPNSELRLLAGYEQELVRNLTAGTQLYAERIQHHDRLMAASPDPDRERDQWRTVATLRLTYRAWQDTLTSSLFVFASPSDEDFYLRPSISWRRDDHWMFSAGLNVFGGRREHTFFGQLEDNSNGWARVRYYY
jgi:hypothetical protein